MIARKNLLQPPRQSAQQLASERSRLYSMRALALKRNDFAEATLIDNQIALMESERGGAAGPNGDAGQGESAADKLALVNERNRKANLEAIRKAEAIESERKRKERKERAIAATALGRNGTPDSRYVNSHSPF